MLGMLSNHAARLRSACTWRELLKIRRVGSSLLLLGLVAAAVLVATPAGAQDGSVAGDKADTSFRYRGQVVDESGNPVADAELVTLSSAKRFRVRGRSAADGSFTLSVKDGYLGIAIAARDGAGTRTGIFPTTPDGSFPPGTTADAIRIVVKKSRDVPVVVRDGSGQPIAGARVAVMVHYDRVDAGTTDGNGEAVLRAPADARLESVYAAKASTGFDYRLYRWPRVPLREPGTLDQYHNEAIGLVLDGVRPVRVRLVDDRQQPLAGLFIAPSYATRPDRGGAFDLSSLDEFASTTDASGGAAWDRFPRDLTGNVAFFTTTPEYFREQPVVFDPASPADDVTGVLLPTVEVRGTVTLADGKPPPETYVQVSGTSYDRTNYWNRPKCEADGTFVIRAPPDGYYAFAAAPGFFAPNAPPLVSSIRTEVLRLREPAEPIRFVLQPGTRVHGVATTGKKHRPIPKLQVQMQRQDDGGYGQLPEGKRLPNPTGVAKSMAPLLVWETRTDEQGRFEFFVPPGKYLLLGPDVQFHDHSKSRPIRPNPPIAKVEVEAGKELEVPLHSESPGEMDVTGRVVFAGDPSRSVPEATIKGVYGGEPFSGFIFRETVTAADGRYQAKRQEAELFLHAATADGLLSGVVAVDEDAAQVDIPVAPTVAVRGRLIDDKTSRPLAGRQIDVAVRIERGRGWTNSFGGSGVTNAGGEFTVTGLTPGWKFHIDMVIQSGGPGGMPMAHQSVGEVTTQPVGLMNLGDLKVSMSRAIWTTDDSVAMSMASYRPPKDRLASLSKEARLANRRILLVAAERESEPLRRFFEIYFGHVEVPPLLRTTLAPYALLAIDTSPSARVESTRTVLEPLGLKPPPSNGALLAILDVDGKLVASADAADLSTENELSPAKLFAFLKAHVPGVPDAEKLLAEGLVQARRDGKRVLIRQGGEFSAESELLARYFERHRDDLAKDYVDVKLDVRFANGEAVIGRFRPTGGKVPWIAILDADGKTLVTGDIDGESIGYPISPAQVGHWEKMLRTTSRRLDDGEIRKLVEGLKTAG